MTSTMAARAKLTGLFSLPISSNRYSTLKKAPIILITSLGLKANLRLNCQSHKGISSKVIYIIYC